MRTSGPNRSSYPTSRLTQWGYKWGTRVFEIPETKVKPIDQALAKIEPNPGIWGKIKRQGLKIARWFVVQTKHDYIEFPIAKLWKLPALKISTPPMGALVILLFPGTMAPRFWHALRRSKDGDYTELFDAMRRDLLAISMYLFALKPLTEALTHIPQKLSGLTLIHKEKHSSRLLTYAQMDIQYGVQDARAIERMVLSGNTRGILNATKMSFSDKKLAEVAKASQVDESVIQHFKTELKKLRDSLTSGLKGFEGKTNFTAQEREKIRSLSQESYKALSKLDTTRQTLIEAAQKVPNNQKIIKAIENNLPQYTRYIADFAKNRKLWVDILSFILVCGGIGYFPVRFNMFWAERRYNKKLAELKAKHGQTQSSSPTFTPSPYSTHPFKAGFPMAQVAFKGTHSKGVSGTTVVETHLTFSIK